MPVIRITDSTWDRLKRWAVPLEDSPEDAVRKALDAAEDHLKCPQSKAQSSVNTGAVPPTRKTHRLAKGLKTPQQAYQRPILEALHQLGGKAAVSQVLNLLGEKMKPILNDVDWQKLPSSGAVRWHNTAQWARFELVNEGSLKNDSPTGIWELSNKAFQELQGNIE